MRGLYSDGAYVRREICVSKSTALPSSWKEIFRFSLFYFVLEGTFQVQVRGGLYLEGRFKERFFALQVRGGFYLEGLIFGILP